MKFIVFFFTLQSHLGGSQETMRGKQLLLPTQSTNSLDPHILLLMCAITTKHYTFNQLLNDQHESFSLKETAWNALNITKPLKSSANFLNRLAWGETSFLVKFYQRLTKDQQWLKLTEWKSQLLWFQNTQLCFRRPLKHRIMLLVLPFNTTVLWNRRQESNSPLSKFKQFCGCPLLGKTKEAKLTAAQEPCQESWRNVTLDSTTATSLISVDCVLERKVCTKSGKRSVERRVPKLMVRYPVIQRRRIRPSHRHQPKLILRHWTCRGIVAIQQFKHLLSSTPIHLPTLNPTCVAAHYSTMATIAPSSVAPNSEPQTLKPLNMSSLIDQELPTSEMNGSGNQALAKLQSRRPVDDNPSLVSSDT